MKFRYSGVMTRLVPEHQRERVWKQDHRLKFLQFDLSFTQDPHREEMRRPQTIGWRPPPSSFSLNRGKIHVI